MLIDIDKIYVERPSLWRIYKDQYPGLPLPKDTAEEWEPARRKGLIFLYLNMFDAFYDFDRHLKWRYLSFKTRSDKEYRRSWIVFIAEFFESCPEAMDLLSQSTRIYSEGFVEFIKNECLRLPK